ncbi:cobyrinate a,c-diamide synthase [Stakelama tenebrarum]|uniref:Cobyrinate a,c-diamide synthase n=1 Tax=Stakelama tenebrarum TaxID=2711215 RepID=A0A6G6Y2N6_9SPHN|nr:cobyrinate a,c-diamide synthase [Sphingosinithalassobacter tenebrarum]QIG79067.1 cobyrinate a,c-diamide synthase [Sphingosinithalassobacter tenebrarum]
MSEAYCPALLVSAPASGQGKTLLTAALARRHRDLGRTVRVFKCGPDFLDPMILERACGAPVPNLDLFMGGEAHCRALLHEAAREADLILVEGVMGLFDGDPSAADLAARLGLPVMATIDGSAMAQSFGALVHGLATYRSDIRLAAVIGNRVGSERHAAMLRDSLKGDVRWLGTMPRDAEIDLPERHLGIVQAGEIADLDARIRRAAQLLPADADWLPEPVALAHPEAPSPPASLHGTRIAIARDVAFAFLYPANVALLRRMGAELRFFSPLCDSRLPDCDALWLPGGYPELHIAQLSENRTMLESIRDHHATGKVILAECGGMIYCADSLNDGCGTSGDMLGILPGHVVMQRRLAALGLQKMAMPEGTLRGHTFHYSRFDTSLTADRIATNPNGGAGERLYYRGSLTASYVHFYFPSNAGTIAGIFGTRVSG